MPGGLQGSLGNGREKCGPGLTVLWEVWGAEKKLDVGIMVRWIRLWYTMSWSFLVSLPQAATTLSNIILFLSS